MSELAGLEYPEGDPGALSDAAARLRAPARGVDAEAASIGRVTRTPAWKGPRAELFSQAARRIATGLIDGTGALAAAASRLDGLADLLDDTQRQVKRWAEEIHDAEAELTEAGRALSSARAGFDVRERFGFSARTAAPDAYLAVVTEAPGRVQAKQDRVDALRARYRPKAAALVEDVRQGRPVGGRRRAGRGRRRPGPSRRAPHPERRAPPLPRCSSSPPTRSGCPPIPA